MAHLSPSAPPVLHASPIEFVGPPPMPSVYTIDDVPLRINIKPDWSYQHGPTIKRDCRGALRVFPLTGPIPPLYEQQAAIQGHCGIGLYVTNPNPEPPTYVDETYERLWQVLWPAVNLVIGSYATGWSLDMRSGVQLLFFDPAVTYGAANRTPDISGSMATVMDSIALPRPIGLPIARWMDMPPDPYAPAMTAIPTTVSGNGSWIPTTVTVPAPLATRAPTSRIPFLVPVSMPSWTAHPPVPLIDCKGALKHLFLLSWFFSFTGATFEHPYGNTCGRCTVAVYLTQPTSENNGQRVRPGNLNVHHEAWKTALALVFRQGTGGFVDLPNGVQVSIYERDLIDPNNVCAFMTRMSMRDCLNNRVQAQERQGRQGTMTNTAASIDRMSSLMEGIMYDLTRIHDWMTPSATSTSAASNPGSQGTKKKKKGKKGG